MEKKKRNRRIVLGMALLFLILAAVMAFRVYMQPNLSPINKNWKSYLTYLSKNEQKEWKSRKQQIKDNFAQINQRIPVESTSGEATIHFVNPPYGANFSKLKLQVEEAEKIVLYESKQILPGTVIETITISRKLSKGKHSGRAYFKFYTDNGNLLSEHDVDVELMVE